MQMISLYDRYLRSNPLTTKMFTNLGICFAGDMICQAITHSRKSSTAKDESWDYLRTARFGVVGACV